MKESIFTKIIKGEIPSRKIYEDEKTFAFLDINPLTPGHTLVVPKTQVEFVWDLSDEDYRAVMETARLVAKRQKSVLQAAYIGEKIVGTDVPHAHVHVIPFDDPSQLNRTTGTPAKQADLAQIAEKLRF